MRKNQEDELFEYKDYESLLLCDQVEEEGESITQIRMRKAFAHKQNKLNTIMNIIKMS
mgnify:CR=1 FL=1